MRSLISCCLLRTRPQSEFLNQSRSRGVLVQHLLQICRFLPPALLMKKNVALIIFAAFWACVVAAGLAVMTRYENTPGNAEPTPPDWPASSRIPQPRGLPSLVLFAHPHCPCTRATMGELARIMAQCGGKLDASVIFFSPQNSAPGWEQTPLRREAAAIPGVRVLDDKDGREARRFGAETSGQTMLYDASGHLLFSGGITASRGHSGDNAGRSAIVALVNGGRAGRNSTPAFGCSLLDAKATADSGTKSSGIVSCKIKP